jgi:hypothetical protein
MAVASAFDLAAFQLRTQQLEPLSDGLAGQSTAMLFRENRQRYCGLSWPFKRRSGSRDK